MSRRQQMIEALVHDRLNTIRSGDSAWLVPEWNDGFKGFNNFTIQELESACEDAGLDID